MGDMQAESAEQTRQEIERKYLLNGMPEISGEVDIWKIEQGYFDRSAEGRIRRTVLQDGSIVCTRTIKHGSGLIRNESERVIPDEEFNRLWPDTRGRRLMKTRFRVRVGDFVWEIDQLHTMNVVLAEVELPTAQTQVELPRWLESHVVREVTDEPEYTNAAIAIRQGALE